MNLFMYTIQIEMKKIYITVKSTNTWYVVCVPPTCVYYTDMNEFKKKYNIIIYFFFFFIVLSCVNHFVNSEMKS